MTFKLTIKKIGNHWYPDIKHDYPEDIKLDEKIDRFLDIVDKNNSKELDLFFCDKYTFILTYLFIFFAIYFWTTFFS